MLILFLNKHGIVHHEFFSQAPEARGINGQCYLDILKQLRARVASIRPKLIATNTRVLHQDNVPPHTSHAVADWLAKNGTTQMLHFSYLLDMALRDFWAFPNVKKALKNIHWGNVEENERVTRQALKTLTQEEFEDCFQQWEGRWSKCVPI